VPAQSGSRSRAGAAAGRMSFASWAHAATQMSALCAPRCPRQAGLLSRAANGRVWWWMVWRNGADNDFNQVPQNANQEVQAQNALQQQLPRSAYRPAALAYQLSSYGVKLADVL
jgi:hypothetical protein